MSWRTASKDLEARLDGGEIDEREAHELTRLAEALTALAGEAATARQ